MKYRIIKNFLDKPLFRKLQQLLFSEQMVWYWKENMTKNDNYFFNHCFYNQMPVSTLYMEYIEPLRDKLNWAALMEARANLMLRQPTSYQSHFHRDRPFHSTIAILYMNNCNGQTLLGEQEKIPINSEENKLLIFDSQIKHCAKSQTDMLRRIVINLNYFETP
jgi:hypothetical protein